MTAGTSITNFSSSGAVSGEAVTSVTLTPNAAGLAATTAAASAYVVTPSLATGSGGFLESNYQVTYNVYNGTVAKQALTVTAVIDTRTYDSTTDSSAVPTITSGALVGTDSVTWTQTFDNKNVGTSKTLTPGGTVNDGNSGNNYAITYTSIATGSITAKVLTVTGITASNKAYDSSSSATLNTTSASLVGVIIGDGVMLNTSSAIGTFSTPEPGYRNVAISGLTISGVDAFNYSLTQPSASADITPPPPPIIRSRLPTPMPIVPIVPTTATLMPSPTSSSVQLHVNIEGQTTSATIDGSGKLQGDATVTSPDQIISLSIPRGTTVLTGNTPTLQITITPDNTPPAPPTEKNTIGIPYECLPDGTTFNPPIPITWHYDPATLPAGTNETKLQVAFYNDVTKQWDPIDAVVDLVNHTVIANISHFSVYAVIAPLPIASVSTAGDDNSWLIIISVLIIVIIIIIFLLTWRRKKGFK